MDNGTGCVNKEFSFLKKVLFFAFTPCILQKEKRTLKNTYFEDSRHQAVQKSTSKQIKLNSKHFKK